MRRSDQFGQTVKTGVRTGKSTMVVHFVEQAENMDAPLVGFVVSKAIGNAVNRNLVKRRLRAIAHEHITDLPVSAMVVVRALPRAAEVEFSKLQRDFEACLNKLAITTSA